MELTRITIKSDFAHFKNSRAGKSQTTHIIPPPSTVLGILKNIYNEDIQNFIFGYSFNCDKKNFVDIQKIYKEVNTNVKSLSDSDRFATDICYIHYLCNVELVIYTNIKEKMLLQNTLNLGKTDCLAKIDEIKEAKLTNRMGKGFNQWTGIETGSGIIRTVTTETVFNERKGFFDIYTEPLRMNQCFEYSYNYDDELKQNIYLWKYTKDGELKCFREDS